MPLITILQEIEKEFEEKFFRATAQHGTSKVFDRVKFEVKIQEMQSFLTQSHIRLLESLKNELPKKATFDSMDTTKLSTRGEVRAFNSCLSTIHQLLDNAIKSIEN